MSESERQESGNPWDTFDIGMLTIVIGAFIGVGSQLIAVILVVMLILTAATNPTEIKEEEEVAQFLSWVLLIMFVGLAVMGCGMIIIAAGKLAAWISGLAGQYRKTDRVESMGIQS